MAFNLVTDRPRFAGDPVTFLRAFASMAVHPERGEIGFDATDLQYVADVWEQAAIVGRGDPAFEHERARYQFLVDNLKMGMHANKTDVGIVILEPHDWAPVPTIIRAMNLLERAEVRGIH